MAWTGSAGGETAGGVRYARIIESAANDNDKLLTLPDVEDVESGARAFLVDSVRIEYDASATAGTREIYMVMESSSGTDTLVHVVTTTLIANETKKINMSPGIGDVGAAIDAAAGDADEIVEAMPGNFMVTGSEQIRFFDANAVHAGDDMTIRVTGRILTKG